MLDDYNSGPSVKLAEICELPSSQVRPIEFSRYRYYVGLEHINGETGEVIEYQDLNHAKLKSSKFPFDSSCILYGKLRPYLNKVALPTVRGVCSTDILPLRPKPESVLKEYLYYAMRAPFFREIATSKSTGANLPRINPSTLLDIRIPLPSIFVQGEIVDRLKSAMELRRMRHQANQLTDNIIRSMFLKIFGGNEPQKRVGDVAKFVSSGSTPLGGEKTYLKNGIIFIRSQNVLMNKIDLESVAHISEDTHRKMRRTWVKDGDVLLNITGASLGRVGVYRGFDDRANVNQHVCIIRLDQSKALPDYVSAYLATPQAQKQIWTIQAGASRQALNFKQVESLEIYLPTMKEQEKFVDAVKTTSALQAKQIQSTEKIKALCDSLVDKAFRGELKIAS